VLPVAVGLSVLVAWFGAQNLAASWINRALLHAPGADKLFHGVQFFVVFLLGHALLHRLVASAPRRRRLAAVVALALAIGDEAQQGLFSGRSVEVADLAANLCGIAAGMAFVAPSWQRATRWAVVTGAAAATLALATNSFVTLRHYNRGLLYEGRQEFALARESFLKTLDSGFESAELYNSLGWVEIESGVGDPVKAVEYAGRSLAMRPDDPDTLDTYGWALHHAGRSEDALHYLRRAYERKPTIFCIHHHLGVVLLALGREEEAIGHFKEQIDEHPNALEAERAKVVLRQLEASAR